MPRFYSPEWVAAFNEAVEGLDLAGVDTGGALGAADGSFTVCQVVHGGPDGDLVVSLVVDGGRLHLEQGDPSDRDAAEAARTTISLSYEDAAAMSRGELDPAEALGWGRVRVRGDLAVLVASQALLAAAGGRLAGLQATTTY